MTQEHLRARSTMTIGEVAATYRDLAKAIVRLQITDDAIVRLCQVDDALRDLEDLCEEIQGRQPIVRAIRVIRRLTAVEVVKRA